MSADTVQTATIETRIPARLDRLPWARFHWLIIVGLGTAWILDGLEVTMVGAVAARLTQPGSGIHLTAGDIGIAGAIYVVGACLGALFFGQLCDRFGRKKLFMITLALYIISTVATAFSFAPWFFFLARFFTGAGIGGEYSAINSAIDELIPARVRGRADLIINGSYWLGSIAGSGAALFFLSGIFPKDLGWRLAFGVGAVIGLAVLFVRRNVPESPRWLFIHGREEQAERLVDGIEHDIEEETGQDLSHPDKTLTVRQRTAIPFREIARVAFKTYPKRSILCLSLFVGQAFLYNGITFNLGTLITTFFGVAAAVVPIFLIIYAAGNFTGPLVLGRLFDTIGRKPMVSATYLGSAGLSVLLAILFYAGTLNSVTFIIVIVAVFFLASSGASAAYLTASEIFPMETRALAIAFFYAIGTGLGGIIGPLLFGKLIATSSTGPVAIAFLIGAGVMVLGGVVELFFGVEAAGQELEDVARPLTADDEANGSASAAPARWDGSAASRERAQADQQRARAAEHRAASHQYLACALGGDDQAAERAETESQLAKLADIAALACDERAAAADERAAAHAEQDLHLELAARERARAAEERAQAHDQEAAALSAAHGAGTGRHRHLAAAARERARSREQKALAAQRRASADADPNGRAEVERARADVHDRWAEMHTQRARAHQAHASGDDMDAAARDTAVAVLAEQARAAEARAEAAEYRVGARDEREEQPAPEQVEGHRRNRRSGLRRYRPGPGRMSSSPGMAVTFPLPPPALDREIHAIQQALGEHGATERRELVQLVGARYWGPGVFRDALREAVADGAVRRTSRSTYAPAAGADERHKRSSGDVSGTGRESS